MNQSSQSSNVSSSSDGSIISIPCFLYFGELNGILSAITKLNEYNFVNDVEIFTDSNCSINSIWKIMNGVKCNKNHKIIKEIEFAIEMCGCRIEIKYVLGHSG